MAIIQTITSRSLNDTINEGLKYGICGTYGTVTNQVILSVDPTRAALVTGFTVSTNSASAILVTLAFAGSPNMPFFQSYVGGSTNAVTREYALGNWYRGALGSSLLLTSTGNCCITVDARVVQQAAVLNYVPQEGAQDPLAGVSGRAFLAPESGSARGQSVG